VTELPLEVEEHLSWLAAERGRAANTLAAYRRDLGHYVEWLDPRRVQDVQPADLESYVAHLRDEGRAASSVARALVAVRGLHRVLAQEGDATGDPGAAVEVPRVPRGLPKALSEGDIDTLLSSVVGDDPRGRRDRAVLELLYGTGLRISELVGLSLRDLDLDGGLLRAFGKGSKERIVPLLGMAHRAMVDWLEPSGRGALVPAQWRRRHDAEAVFLNLRGGRLTRQGAWLVVKGHAQRVGLADRVYPHVLRHSCATHLLDHGADIRVVQELLGHASISTTQVYTLVSQERLRAAYEGAHPRARRAATPR
jgi:integrase/recombinase XerD